MGSRRGGSGIRLVAACMYTSAVIANPSAEAPIHQPGGSAIAPAATVRAG
jgi:hypothetical protein